MSELIGKVISHDHILEQIGQGGIGVIYKAEDTKFNVVYRGREFEIDDQLSNIADEEAIEIALQTMQYLAKMRRRPTLEWLVNIAR